MQVEECAAHCSRHMPGDIPGMGVSIALFALFAIWVRFGVQAGVAD